MLIKHAFLIYRSRLDSFSYYFTRKNQNIVSTFFHQNLYTLFSIFKTFHSEDNNRFQRLQNLNESKAKLPENVDKHIIIIGNGGPLIVGM